MIGLNFFDNCLKVRDNRVRVIVSFMGAKEDVEKMKKLCEGKTFTNIAEVRELAEENNLRFSSCASGY